MPFKLAEFAVKQTESHEVLAWCADAIETIGRIRAQRIGKCDRAIAVGERRHEIPVNEVC